MSAPAKLETAGRLVADVVVARAYDAGRTRGYLDLGRGRRASALERLERRAWRALESAQPGGAYSIEADVEGADPELVAAAFARLVRTRLAHHAAGPAVRNALRRAAVELELEELVAALGPELELIRDRSRRGRMVVA
jgi:hypothetical protein